MSDLTVQWTVQQEILCAYKDTSVSKGKPQSNVYIQTNYQLEINGRVQGEPSAVFSQDSLSKTQ